jgi:hypothetical protein
MEFAMNHEIERVKIVVYPDGRLNSENAARFLGFSPKTLAMMRTAGTGPKFVKRGRVFYYMDDLEAWLSEQPRVRSTAQARMTVAPPRSRS